MQTIIQLETNQNVDHNSHSSSFHLPLNPDDVHHAPTGGMRNDVDPALEEGFPWMRVRRLPKKG
ncbi:hypothetical protein ACFQUU_28040 [Herbaspirillum sp. GCM10030257]|uniref:hypothetical protein n=1 Tax=Herbaspirillum sp. GCM10030257 TaxID=3273393 RepID=UPI00361866EC